MYEAFLNKNPEKNNDLIYRNQILLKFIAFIALTASDIRKAK